MDVTEPNGSAESGAAPNAVSNVPDSWVELSSTLFSVPWGSSLLDDTVSNATSNPPDSCPTWVFVSSEFSTVLWSSSSLDSTDSKGSGRHSAELNAASKLADS